MNIYFIGPISLIPYSNDIKIATINDCYNYLKDKKVISIDIETTRKFGLYEKEGLDPYTSKIVMFQIGDENNQYIIDYRSIKISKLLPLLENGNIVKVGHNIKFEYLHILHNENIRLNNLYDTMIVEQILLNGLNPQVSLKKLNEKYLNISVNKDTRLEFLSIKSKPFTERQIKYGAEDIYYPLKIKEIQEKEVLRKRLQKCVRLEMLFTPVLGDIEYKGMTFNENKWKDTYQRNLKLFKIYKDKLDNFVLDNYKNTKFINKQLSLFDSGINCNISWASPKQVIEFFVYLNACPKEVSKTTGKLSYTVNGKVIKSSLNTINKHQPEKIKEFLKNYIEYKEYEQLCTTFGLEFLKYINPITKRIHSNYKQILTTGRISSRDPKKLGVMVVIL